MNGVPLRTEIAVTGMTCASCVNHVGRALRKVSGVADASVNLATERATVDHEPSVSAEALLGAIERAGYGAAVVTDEGGDEDERRRERELARKRVLLVVAVALFVPTLVLGMFAPEFPYKDWVMFALTLPVWLVVGGDFHRDALSALRHGTASMDSLVSLGSSAAFLYSVYATLAMQPTYYETASAIVTLVFVGKYLETRTRSRSNAALRSLLALRPQNAHVRVNGETREVPVDAIRAGDEVIVAAGERIPVDGTVVSGASTIDVSMLTGEPVPVDVEPGSTVAQGTLNGDGTIVLRAERVGAGTTLARIVEIVKRAQGSTPKVQRLADRVAGVFVPIILVIAALTFIGWLLTHHSAVAALVAAVAVLVVACPCALGLATPTAIIASVGAAARNGILLRDADAIERLAHVDAVVFDKTGTLTEGKPRVMRVLSFNGATESDVLATAAALEAASRHPLARAILEYSRDNGVNSAHATDVQASRGFGVAGTIDGVAAAAGNARFMQELNVAVEPSASTTVYVARDTQALGSIEFADVARPEAVDAVRQLHELGMKVSIVSGDADVPTRDAAQTVGADDWRARALPEEKAAFVRELQTAGRFAAFVGDGINDAPALATASVGIAMGGGSEIALETAQVALISNDSRDVAAAIRLSQRAMRTIRQNLFWAFAYNALLVPLAAFGIVHPIFAAAAMGASSLFVVGNSLRLNVRSKTVSQSERNRATL